MRRNQHHNRWRQTGEHLSQRHASAGRCRKGEAGDTLIEVLIALTVITLTAAALLGGFETSISASAQNRNLAGEDTVLKAYIESVTYQLGVQSSSSPTFNTQCQGMSTYATLAKSQLSGGITYSLTVTDSNYPIEYWVAGTGFTASGCTAYSPSGVNPPQQQLLTAEISASGVPTQTISFAVSDPTYNPGAATAPAFQSNSSDIIVGNGSTYTFPVSVTAYPSPTLSMSTSSPTPPTWVTFVDNGGGSGTITMDPAASDASPTAYTVQLNAMNSVGSQSQTFNITVGSVPMFTSTTTSYSTLQGSSFTSSPAITASGIPAPTITATNTLPPGVTLNTSTTGTTTSATFMGTSSVATGVYTIDLLAESSAGSASLTFTLTVSPPTPPSFTPVVGNTTEPYGLPFTLSISTSGEPAATISDAGSTLPSGVTFSTSAGSAQISGTPTDSTPTLASIYTIVLTASNGSLPNAVDSFVLTISPQSSPTISTPNSSKQATGSKNNSFSFQVSGTGFITTGTTTITFNSGKVTGTANVLNSTTLTVTCTGTKSGTYSFSITNPDGGQTPASQGQNAVVIS